MDFLGTCREGEVDRGGDSHWLLSGSSKTSAADEVASVGFGSSSSSPSGILGDPVAWASASRDSEA